MTPDARQRIGENPFYVLGVPPACTRAEAERAGQKLLAMLELGLGQAAAYGTPLGPRTRTPELVRWALAELREPERRLRHELWAQLDPNTPLPEPVTGVRAGDGAAAGVVVAAAAPPAAAPAVAPSAAPAAAPAPPGSDTVLPWAEAMRVLGWGAK